MITVYKRRVYFCCCINTGVDTYYAFSNKLTDLFKIENFDKEISSDINNGDVVIDFSKNVILLNIDYDSNLTIEKNLSNAYNCFIKHKPEEFL